jgi:hypothetical protein
MTKLAFMSIFNQALAVFTNKRNNVIISGEKIKVILKTVFGIFENQNTEEDELKKIERLFSADFMDKVNSDFNKYKIKEEMKLTIENNTLTKRFTYLIMFCNEIALNIKAKYENDRNVFIQYRMNTCGKIYYKSIQTCMDMLSLFEKGALPSSFLLWRSIYNDYVIAKFLSQSSENISECYNEYSRVQRYVLAKDKSSLTEEEIKELRKKYGNNFNNNYGWALNIKGNRNFNAIRKCINETKYYTEYKFSSMYHHASSFSVNNSVFFDNEKHSNVDMLGIFSKNIEIPYNLTVSLMKDFTDTMINTFLNDEYCELILAFNALIENRFIIQNDRN